MTRHLEVDLGPGLHAHLAPHDGAATVRGAVRNGCCGTTVIVPVVDAGPPKGAAGHVLVEREGIRVFVDGRLLTDGPNLLRIGIEGFGRWRRLWLEGLGSQII